MKYYLPPEWSPQDAVMLTWPHSHSDWADNLVAVEQEFLQLAKAIVETQGLLIVCYDNQHKTHIDTLLKENHITTELIMFFIADSNDSWARDHGPISVYSSEQKPLLLNFQFNGWGNKYPATLDNQITQTLFNQQAFPNADLETLEIILEGGSIEVNGEGTLLTTTQCLLNENRNPFSKSEWLEKLENLLGIQQILWLEHGHLEGDDTDSHIDTLARFINSHTICYVKCDDINDSHHEDFQKMEQQLQGFRNINNEAFKLVPLPWPKPQYNEQDQRLPLSYANFLITNESILVPNYNDPADKLVETTLSKLFPTHKIIGIPSVQIIKQFGSIHCLTMQIPTGIINER